MIEPSALKMHDRDMIREVREWPGRSLRDEMRYQVHMTVVNRCIHTRDACMCVRGKGDGRADRAGEGLSSDRPLAVIG